MFPILAKGSFEIRLEFVQIFCNIVRIASSANCAA